MVLPGHDRVTGTRYVPTMTNRSNRPKQTPAQTAGGCLAVLVVAGLAFWGLGALFGGGSPDVDVFTAMGADRAQLTAYEPTDESTNEAGGLNRATATLVMPDVTVPQAQAAMADYISKSDAEYTEVIVVRDVDAPVYVCTGRYATDERAAAVWMGSERGADLPVVQVNCPDPAGN